MLLAINSKCMFANVYNMNTSTYIMINYSYNTFSELVTLINF